MEVHNAVRVRVVALNIDEENGPLKTADAVDVELTKVIESSYKEHFKVVSMAPIVSNGTTWAIAITFEHFA